MTQPIYAIGDIHGQLQKLQEVLERITSDGGADATVVFLGDYIDRGPDSRGVLDYLINAQPQNPNWVFLKGNHDRFLEWYLHSPQLNDPHMLIGLHWLHPRLGGDKTLRSYGVEVSENIRQGAAHKDAQKKVPNSHLEFLKSLPLSHQIGDLFFVHAGIRPGIALKSQEENDLLWIRQEFHIHTAPHPALIVHGHTPVDKPTHYGNRVNLDTGAGYGKALTAAVFERGKVWHLTDTGRELLKPKA